jgi:hypothetical protein
MLCCVQVQVQLHHLQLLRQVPMLLLVPLLAHSSLAAS